MKIEAKTETQLPPHEIRSILDEYEGEKQRLVKQRKHMAVFRNDHTRRSPNSFNECFAIAFSILGSHFRCTWMIDWPKSMCHAYYH